MHILICDDDAAFGTRMAEYVAAYFAARSILVQTAVCTSAGQALETPELKLVYVSAYLEFALEGYTVNAYRYLLKRDIVHTLPSCLDDLLAELTDQRKTLTVHHNRAATEIPLDQIYYLESDLRQINVYGDIPRQPICTYYGKIADLPQMLYENGFLQVSRSDVVNMKYVRSIRSYRALLKNGVELSVSRAGYAAIQNAYLEWKGQYVDE